MGRLTDAVAKRNEQLKHWKDSETNNTPEKIPEDKKWKVKFDEGCVFLAACAANDFKEVERLLKHGVDINTTNIDGLTALHQACIDDNLDMVKYLVSHPGCAINKGDNEGWTPLHAAASCGHTSIARYLIENGADIAAINNDGDLPIDITESEEMEEILQKALEDQGIDCEAAREAEEQRMLEDAMNWLQTNQIQDQVHPLTGATALHVAAAKGYTKVMSILIRLGADLNAQDVDGWTPLHAAAHWGQREACTMLAENLCNMDLPNFIGQTCFDVADPELLPLLEELKKKQTTLQQEHPEIGEILQRKPRPPLKRKTTVTRMSVATKNKVVREDLTAERAAITPVLEEEELGRKDIFELAEEEEEGQPPTKVTITLPNKNGEINGATREEQKERKGGPIIEEVTSPTETQFKKTLPPPTRDEGSETQRKAHAKRVRETRRSTQGVSLEDVKTAEQLLQTQTQKGELEGTKKEEPPPSLMEDQKEKENIKLEVELPSPVEAPPEPTSPDSPAVTLPLRVKKISRQESKESEGVARQKRPKRRSSGVVYLDLEQLGIKSPEENETNGKESSPVDAPQSSSCNKNSYLDAKEIPSIIEPSESRNHSQKKKEEKTDSSLTDRYGSRPGRYGSSSHLSDNSDLSSYTRRSGSTGSLDHHVDFKKLYEDERDENKKLKQKLEQTEDELEKTKKQLLKLQQNNRNAQNEQEKKEKRMLERKISEMEEEIKKFGKLREENEKLKAENRALTRAVAQLSK